jgi:hypothetical protein
VPIRVPAAEYHLRRLDRRFAKALPDLNGVLKRDLRVEELLEGRTEGWRANDHHPTFARQIAVRMLQRSC